MFELFKKGKREIDIVKAELDNVELPNDISEVEHEANKLKTDINEEMIKLAEAYVIEKKKLTILQLSDYLEISYEQAQKIIIELMNREVIKADYRDIVENVVYNDLTDDEEDQIDPFLEEAIKLVVEFGQASTSLIQRRLEVGYARAGRIIDQMEERGIITGYEGTKPRKVLITVERLKDIENIINNVEKNINKKEAEININKIYEFDEDYLREYEDVDIDGIKNIFIENASDTLYEEIIENFVISSNPENVKVIIMNIDFLKVANKFNGKKQLLIPVINDINKMEGCFNWCIEEIKRRYNMLSANYYKNLEEYRNDDREKIPQILIMIDDYSMIKFYSSSLNIINDYIQEIILRGERVGVYVIIGSKCNIEDSGLSKVSKYLKVKNNEEIDRLIKQQHETHNETIKLKSIEEIDKCSGIEFEMTVKQVLVNNNFKDVVTTKSSGDQGADVIAYKDGIKYAIQCKRFSQSVGNFAIQEVIGSKSIYNCHVAVVLTNNFFTKSAKELADKNQVLLWDRNKLIELLQTTNNVD